MYFIRYFIHSSSQMYSINVRVPLQEPTLHSTLCALHFPYFLFPTCRNQEFYKHAQYSTPNSGQS